jgi:pimeloyl-ACP methyl ester carboxylesterase
MHEHRVEDRVFGRPELFPPLPIVTRPSTSFDLLSVRVEGAEAVYAQEGRLALPPLVFLHGWGASHKFWRWTLPAFAPRRRCIAPDWVGFGRSEKPRGRAYTMEALAGWLGSFLDALGIGQAELVGHSMGGTIALLFALAHPERVSRLALSNPLVDGGSAFNRRTRMLMAWPMRSILFPLGRCGPLRRWATRDFSYVQNLDDDLAADVVAGTYESTMGSLLSLRSTDLRPRLSSLAVPTLAIGTDRDELIAPAQADLVPARRRARIAETGHIPMVERPAEFNRVLHEWLSAPAE